MDSKQFHIRTNALVALVLALILALGSGLYGTQIVRGADYARQSYQKIANKETVEASRGNITDANGRLLVSNRISYQVTLDTGRMGDARQRNEILSRLIDICMDCGVEWN
ncbi:MAG: penicillin-binding protein, partial [Oscillospiraceae bacterium]|nr:penicillin-binding protein [Oscillospiraceae bacterium]